MKMKISDVIITPSVSVCRELRHWPSTREDMHCPLDWRDPYEEQWLEVRSR